MTTRLLNPLFAIVAVTFPLATINAQVEIETKTVAKPKKLAENATVTDWPSFLGEKGQPISTESPLIKRWDKDGPRLLWTRNRGAGYASPSIAGGKLVLFHRLGDQETIECLDAISGNSLWKHQYGCNYRDRYGFNNGPRATPIIHNGHVYTLGVQGKLNCLNLKDGAVVWTKDLAEEYHIGDSFFGVGASPIIEDNSLIINIGAIDGPCVVAFDAKTGKERWQAGDQWGASYASPVAATIHGKRRIFVFAGGERRPPVGGLLCIDPENGAIDFRVAWRSKTVESVNAANPVIVRNDRVFISASYNTGGAMISINKDFKPETRWTTDKLATHMTTSVYHEGHLYGIDGRHQQEAAIVCMNAKTGKEIWRWQPTWDETYEAYGSKRTRPFEIGRGSLIHVDGAFLCVGEMGHLLWLDLSPEKHEILAKHWMFGAPESWTPPVVSHGLLYIMQNDTDRINAIPPRLLCYDLRGR